MLFLTWFLGLSQMSKQIFGQISKIRNPLKISNVHFSKSGSLRNQKCIDRVDDDDDDFVSVLVLITAIK